VLVEQGGSRAKVIEVRFPKKKRSTAKSPPPSSRSGG